MIRTRRHERLESVERARSSGPPAPKVVLHQLGLLEAPLRCTSCGWRGLFGDLKRGHVERGDLKGTLAEGFPGCPRCRTDKHLTRDRVTAQHQHEGVST